MLKPLLIGLAALTLIGCEAQDGAYSDQFETLAEADFAPAPPMMEPAASRQAKGADNSTGAEPGGVYLAYRYGYGLVMPAASVKSTADKHLQICREAGPSKCQITSSSTNNYSATDVRANLALRAEPEWLQGFVTRMKSDVTEVDGRIENEITSVEDLTRAILDTDARLKAQTTLRTRLENLLETRNAELPDLLALERELARVQGEIESATANLKALRARVSMSVVNISYTSESVAISQSSFTGIRNALEDFMENLMDGLAGVVTFFAFVLPWFIFVILPGLLGLRWLWRRRGKKKAA